MRKKEVNKMESQKAKKFVVRSKDGNNLYPVPFRVSSPEGEIKCVVTLGVPMDLNFLPIHQRKIMFDHIKTCCRDRYATIQKENKFVEERVFRSNYILEPYYGSTEKMEELDIELDTDSDESEESNETED